MTDIENNYYTLMHGDCLERMKEIPDGSVDMVMCDPPYGTTACAWDAVIPFEPMWVELKRVTKSNAAIVLVAQTPFDKMLGVSNIKELRYEFIWQKEAGTGHLNAKKAPMKNHENILVFYASPPTYNPQMRTGFKPYSQKQGKTKSENYGKQTGAVTTSDGSRYPLTVINFPRDREKSHPTQKPVALMEYLIRTYTNEDQTVLDFTMGSGTTGVAAMNQKRKFIGIERDGKYFSIAAKRIEDAFNQSVYSIL
jgi:site-specific DNA-methyltransferase (adenine-specific)